jgi:septal ring factor EnvC (AmiA/AmiB activator)
MTIFDEVQITEGESQDSRLSMWMLDQMAEGLEDQAAGLSRRAAGFEEEESLLTKEIARHETEINRLLLRLDAVRSDRDSVVERIESLKREASGIREQLFVCEEEAALAAIDPASFQSEMAPTHQVYRAPVTRPLNAA